MTDKEQQTGKDERYGHARAYLSKDLQMSNEQRDLARRFLSKSEKVGKIVQGFIDLNYRSHRWECGMLSINAVKSDAENRLSLLPKYDFEDIWVEESLFHRGYSYDELDLRKCRRDELEKRISEKIENLENSALKNRKSALDWASGRNTFKTPDREMEKYCLDNAEREESRVKKLSVLLREMLETPYADRLPLQNFSNLANLPETPPRENPLAMSEVQNNDSGAKMNPSFYNNYILPIVKRFRR